MGVQHQPEIHQSSKFRKAELRIVFVVLHRNCSRVLPITARRELLCEASKLESLCDSCGDYGRDR